jgi:hypothetical protein
MLHFIDGIAEAMLIVRRMIFLMISVSKVSGTIPESPLVFTIKNANHERVLSAIEKLIHDRNSRVCACERCVSDVAALALNFLPPHYYVDADRNVAFGSPWVMIENAVKEAFGRVMENPRHRCIVQPPNTMCRP